VTLIKEGEIDMKKRLAKHMNYSNIAILLIALNGSSISSSVAAVSSPEKNMLAGQELAYAIVDTNQTECIGISDKLTSCPRQGSKSYGQDAQYKGLAPSYVDNKDGTITDQNTQLMWANTTDINNDGSTNLWPRQISLSDRLACFSYHRVTCLISIYRCL
jgi:hypothetical protein